MSNKQQEFEQLVHNGDKTYKETHFRLRDSYIIIQSCFFILYSIYSLVILLRYKGSLALMSKVIIWVLGTCFALKVGCYIAIWLGIGDHLINQKDNDYYQYLLIGAYPLDVIMFTLFAFSALNIIKL